MRVIMRLAMDATPMVCSSGTCTDAANNGCLSSLTAVYRLLDETEKLEDLALNISHTSLNTASNTARAAGVAYLASARGHARAAAAWLCASC